MYTVCIDNMNNTINKKSINTSNIHLKIEFGYVDLIVNQSKHALKVLPK